MVSRPRLSPHGCCLPRFGPGMQRKFKRCWASWGEWRVHPRTQIGSGSAKEGGLKTGQDMQLDDTRWWIDGEEFGFLLDDIEWPYQLIRICSCFLINFLGWDKGPDGPIAIGTGTQMGKQLVNIKRNHGRCFVPDFCSESQRLLILICFNIIEICRVTHASRCRRISMRLNHVISSCSHTMEQIAQ